MSFQKWFQMAANHWRKLWGMDESILQEYEWDAKEAYALGESPVEWADSLAMELEIDQGILS